MDSPYRPPQEIESDAYPTIAAAPGEFRFLPDEQRMVGKLAKYMGDIGGLLIFAGFVLGLIFVFSALASLGTIGVMAADMGILAIAIQLFQQLVSIVCFYAIGIYMRRAAKSFRTASVTSENPVPNIMNSMQNLQTMYGWHIAYIGIGILITVVALGLSLPL